MNTTLEIANEVKLGEWIAVKPIHCHQRLPENTLISKLRVLSKNKVHAELLMKFKPEELTFFFDHVIDHLPGMLEACGLRQCALALAHLVYDVPMDYIALLDWINIRLYNYGELNTETIVKSKLFDIKRDKNKITLVLEGLMVQNGYPLMRMRGEFFAFNPRFAEKVRHKKIKLEELNEKSESQKPFIAELHVMIRQSLWQQAYGEIMSMLKGPKINRYSLSPLYVTHDTDDSELRICFEFKDPSLIDKFIVRKIRTIAGVDATKVRLTLDGQIFPKGIKALAATDTPYESCHVFLKIDPLKDTKVWRALSALDDKGSAFPTWIFRDFYEYDRDVTLRLAGKNQAVIKEYVDSHIAKIEGILSYKMKFMAKIEKILDDGKLMNLAQQWLKTR